MEVVGDEFRLERRVSYIREIIVLFKDGMRVWIEVVVVGMLRRDVKEYWYGSDLEINNVREERDCRWWMRIFYRLGNDSLENDVYI